jgi:hypothetical protein
MRNSYYGNGRRRGTGYWGSLVKLLTHLLGTAVMFGAILMLAWGLSYLVSELNAAHPFPPAIYAFVTTIEIWLVYIDVLISGIVFLFGAGRFLQEVWEDR